MNKCKVQMGKLPIKINSIKVPPLKIQGIKTKLIPFIFSSVNWDGKGVYWEPFMGSGVVGFNLAPKKAIFSDTNPYIIDFYKAIQSGAINSRIVKNFLEEESVKLISTPADKNSYYYEVRDRFNKTHNPLDFLFLQRTNFNGMMRFNAEGNYNVPFCRKPERLAPALITKITNQVKWVEGLIADRPEWEFKVASFEKQITQVKLGDFIYLDPPYVNRHDGYYDEWSEDKANYLAELTQQSKGGYALSMWHSNKHRTNGHLTRWNKGHLVTTEHFYFVGAKEKNRGTIVEALVISPSNVNYQVV